ncbi:unnamed protein product, partial [Prorocentrum cordatum]
GKDKVLPVSYACRRSWMSWSKYWGRAHRLLSPRASRSAPHGTRIKLAATKKMQPMHKELTQTNELEEKQKQVDELQTLVEERKSKLEAKRVEVAELVAEFARTSALLASESGACHDPAPAGVKIEIANAEEMYAKYGGVQAFLNSADWVEIHKNIRVVYSGGVGG